MKTEEEFLIIKDSVIDIIDQKYDPELEYKPDILLEFYFIDIDEFINYLANTNGEKVIEYEEERRLTVTRDEKIIYQEGRITITKANGAYSETFYFYYHLSEAERIKIKTSHLYNCKINNLCLEEDYGYIIIIVENGKIVENRKLVSYDWNYLNILAQNSKEGIELLLKYYGI